MRTVDPPEHSRLLYTSLWFDSPQDSVFLRRDECQGYDTPTILAHLLQKAKEAGCEPSDLGRLEIPHIYLQAVYICTKDGAGHLVSEVWAHDVFVMYVREVSGNPQGVSS